MQRCYVIGNSRTNPPRINEDGLPTPGDFCHINQFGGFEGMRQKMWTIPTICAIQLAAEMCNIKINVIGQGDNQVILIKWSTNQRYNREELRKNFIEVIYNTFLDIGLMLKKEETWVSSRLMEYGKIRYLYGAAVPNSTKRAARIIPDEHDGIPTFDTSLCIVSTATENIAMSKSID